MAWRKVATLGLEGSRQVLSKQLHSVHPLQGTCDHKGAMEVSAEGWEQASRRSWVKTTSWPGGQRPVWPRTHVCRGFGDSASRSVRGRLPVRVVEDKPDGLLGSQS